jgi:hypothetical protein
MSRKWYIDPGRYYLPLISWNVCTHSELLGSYKRTVLSSEHVTMSWPSGAKRAQRTQLLCPRRAEMNFFLATPHILTLLSSDAVTIRCPSGEKWMDRTVPVWARNSAVSPWAVGTQRRTLRSRDTEATKCPDGEKHISITPSLWALNLCY